MQSIKIKLCVTSILLLSLSIFSSCHLNKVTFQAHKDDKYYDRVSPCEPKVVVKIEDDELKNYDFIGICYAKMRAGTLNVGKKNNTLEAIEKCACKNGGHLIRIMTIKEVQGIHPSAGGLLSINNPHTPKKVVYDELEAEIYRKK